MITPDDVEARAEVEFPEPFYTRVEPFLHEDDPTHALLRTGVIVACDWSFDLKYTETEHMTYQMLAMKKMLADELRALADSLDS